MMWIMDFFYCGYILPVSGKQEAEKEKIWVSVWDRCNMRGGTHSSSDTWPSTPITFWLEALWDPCKKTVGSAWLALHITRQLIPLTQHTYIYIKKSRCTICNTLHKDTTLWDSNQITKISVVWSHLSR